MQLQERLGPRRRVDWFKWYKLGGGWKKKKKKNDFWSFCQVFERSGILMALPKVRGNAVFCVSLHSLWMVRMSVIAVQGFNLEQFD